jgi:EmrB/QacA subfamily drug resistance transporter
MNNKEIIKFQNPIKTPILPLRVILPITSIGVFMSALDGSIVNVSLLTIQKAFDTDIVGVRWVVIIYLLTTSAIMGLSGSLGDVFGRKKIFSMGMIIFITGSLFCGLSFTLELLVISRIIQAIGSSALIANGLAIVMTYADPRFRGRAIGINSFVVASALTTGPVVGGILTEFIGWQSVFLINIPIGGIGVVLILKNIPETPKKNSINFDFIGSFLFAITIFSFVGGIIFFFDGTWIGLIFIIFSVFTAFFFVYCEYNHSNPMLPVQLMINKKIAAGAFGAFFSYMALNGAFFLLPFFYQEMLGFRQSETGLLMIVSPLVMSITGPITGILAEKFEARKLATLGALLQGTFILILSTINPEMSLITILFLVALAAGSLNIFTNSNSTSVMNASPKDYLSIVSGVLNLSRTIAFSLGTGLSTAFFSLFFSINNPSDEITGLTYKTAYYQALSSTFLLICLFSYIAGIISILRGKEN